MYDGSVQSFAVNANKGDIAEVMPGQTMHPLARCDAGLAAAMGGVVLEASCTVLWPLRCAVFAVTVCCCHVAAGSPLGTGLTERLLQWRLPFYATYEEAPCERTLASVVEKAAAVAGEGDC